MHQATRHSQFYFADGSVVFLLEDTLFRLHKYLFESSVIFNDMFALPQGSTEPEGRTDDFPIKLAEVKVSDFVCLCRLFYPKEHGVQFTASFDEWTSILEVSSRFMFEAIRTRAIRELHNVPYRVVEKIVLARRYDIPDWLIPLYTSLCRQSTFVSKEEARLLGVDTVSALARAREGRRNAPATASSSPYCTLCKASSNVTAGYDHTIHSTCGHRHTVATLIAQRPAAVVGDITESEVKLAFAGL